MIFLKRPSQVNVCSHIIVLALGNSFFKTLGLKSTSGAFVVVEMYRESIIFIRLSFHKLGKDLMLARLHIKVTTKTSFSRINERGSFSHSILGTTE